MTWGWRAHRHGVATWLLLGYVVLVSILPWCAAQTATPTSMPNTRAVDPSQDVGFTIDVTQPVVCQPMNVTFDPRKGTPPYSLMIAIEDWWPLVVDLPATYDDPTKALWLYQFPVPTFNGATTNPNLIVSVVDSSGLISNSSIILHVQNSTSGTATCAPYAGEGDFIFYTEKAASQCQDYDIVWKGNYTAPLELVFLPEAAPPIYVPVASDRAVAGNMTWTVAMRGGTRFLLTMGDAGVNTGGVSKLNIVALNEYFGDACITQNTYAHNVLPVQTTAAPASVFPDATSTIASLSTSNGIVATVTSIETIRAGRTVGQDSNGLSPKAFLAIMIVVFLGIGIGGVVLGWCCFRRRQRRKQNIKTWDFPSSDPLVPLQTNPNMPIAPGFLGSKRQHSETDGLHRPSYSAANSFSDLSPSRQPGQQRRTSLRSWTSTAYDQLQHVTAGATRSSHRNTADEYPLVNTNVNNPFSNTHAVAGQDRGVYRSYSGSSSIASASRTGRSRDSIKSSRVGPGATYRPDAASQAAYQDLLTDTASPPGSMPSLVRLADTSRDQSPARSDSIAVQRNPRFVRHADAGLLLDDNADDDDDIYQAGHFMELPPEYDTIQRAQQQRQHTTATALPRTHSGDIAEQHNDDNVHPTAAVEEDESEYWNNAAGHAL